MGPGTQHCCSLLPHSRPHAGLWTPASSLGIISHIARCNTCAHHLFQTNKLFVSRPRGSNTATGQTEVCCFLISEACTNITQAKRVSAPFARACSIIHQPYNLFSGRANNNQPRDRLSTKSSLFQRSELSGLNHRTQCFGPPANSKR